MLLMMAALMGVPVSALAYGFLELVGELASLLALHGVGDGQGGQVGEGDQVVHLVVQSPHSGFPDLSFLALSVAAEAIYTGVVTGHLLAERDAGRYRKALSEGA